MKIISEKQANKRNILYYPTINIPTDDWLRNAVLYWDEVSSIVPQDWENKHLIELSPDIRYLMDEGQFRSIRPDGLISDRKNRHLLNDFEEELFNIIDSEKFKGLLKRTKQKFAKLHNEKFSRSPILGKGSRIHREKMFEGLFYTLERKGLARKEMKNWEWIRVESNTALLYMSVLAKYLAELDKQHTVIGTDLAIYEEFNFKLNKKKGDSPILSCDFRNLIPSPDKNVSIKKIIRFKRRRESNLIAFRNVLLDAQNKVSKAESNEHLKEVITSFQEDMRKGLIDMAAVFKDSKIDLVFKSLKSLLTYKSSTAVTGTALLLNEKYEIAGLPDWVKAFAIAVAGTIDVTTNYIDARNKQRAEDRRSAFSYLYHAERKGIVNKFSP